jgi:signal peptidase II
LKKALFTIFGVLALDQWIKIWVKLNFNYGESKTLIDGWFDLQFVENPGMAFGWMLGGEGGKIALSLFRIIVVTGIGWYLLKIIKQKAHWGYIVSVSLIVAGALGNIVDSLLYGSMFDMGCVFDPELNDYNIYYGKSLMNWQGYAPPLMGNVVDMMHFTKVVHFPQWFPIWGGQTREIFPPVFNLADSSITAGIICILLWQKKFFVKHEEPTPTVEQVEMPAEEATISEPQ